jgi:hypothetical protein
LADDDTLRAHVLYRITREEFCSQEHSARGAHNDLN